jgi:hypothetical protein
MDIITDITKVVASDHAITSVVSCSNTIISVSHSHAFSMGIIWKELTKPNGFLGCHRRPLT